MQGHNRDERWRVDFRVVSTNHLLYVQIQFQTEEWFTLSAMHKVGNNYHFERYRNWTDEEAILKWWKTSERTNILNTNVWMPSKALYDIEVITTSKALINKYPELII